MAASSLGIRCVLALPQASPATTATMQCSLTDLHGLDHLLTHRKHHLQLLDPLQALLLDGSPFRLRSSPVSTMP